MKRTDKFLFISFVNKFNHHCSKEIQNDWCDKICGQRCI